MVEKIKHIAHIWWWIWFKFLTYSGFMISFCFILAIEDTKLINWLGKVSVLVLNFSESKFDTKSQKEKNHCFYLISCVIYWNVAGPSSLFLERMRSGEDVLMHIELWVCLLCMQIVAVMSIPISVVICQFIAGRYRDWYICVGTGIIFVKLDYVVALLSFLLQRSQTCYIWVI